MTSRHNQLHSLKVDQFARWAQSFAKAHRVEIYEVPIHASLREIMPFHTYSVHFKYKGADIWASGSGSTKEEAILKALVESCERAAGLVFFPLTDSNGNACHFSKALAVLGAKREALERDAFFSHFLLREPFIPIKAPWAVKADNVRAAKKAKVKIEFFLMNCADSSLKAVLCAASGWSKNGKAMALGAACDATVTSASRKSYQEAMKNFNGIRLGVVKPMSESERLRRLRRQFGFGPEAHLQLGADEKFVREFSKNYLRFKGPRSKKKLGFTVQWKIQSHDLRGTDFQDSGLCLVRAESPDLQSTFWSYPSPHRVNFPRLARWSKNLRVKDLPWDKLHLFP
ncbi:MAG: YcaO-like family protein [Pseudobdellovibrionaceae bacterium]